MCPESRSRAGGRWMAGFAAGAVSLISILSAAPAGALSTQRMEDFPRVRQSTPACVVQAAMFLPMALGFVMMTNPTFLPQFAERYWTGGPGPDGSPQSDRPGWLQQCGLLPAGAVRA